MPSNIRRTAMANLEKEATRRLKEKKPRPIEATRTKELMDEATSNVVLRRRTEKTGGR